MEQTSIMKRIIFLQNHKTKQLSTLVNENNESEIFKIEEPEPNYLSAFVYTDHITNKKFTITDQISFKSSFPKQRRTYIQGNSEYNQKYSQFNHMNSNLKQCLKLLKSTRMFHLNSLKNKNYKKRSEESSHLSAELNKNQQIQRINKEKMEKYVKMKMENKENYRKEKLMFTRMLETSMASFHFNDKDGQSVRKIQRNSSCNLEMKTKKAKTLPISQNVNTNQKLLKFNIKKDLQRSRTLKDFILQRKSKKNFDNFPQDLSQDKIMENIDEELKYKIRKNGEFLVTPRLEKRLMTDYRDSKNKRNQQNLERSRKQLKKQKYGLSRKSRTSFMTMSAAAAAASTPPPKQRQTTKPVFFEPSQISSFTFHPVTKQTPFEEQKLDFPNWQNRDSPDNQMNQKAKNKNMDSFSSRLDDSIPYPSVQQMKKLFKSIQKGAFFQVQIQLSLNPRLFVIRDQTNGNNLLHFCVMNNRHDIFNMILKRSIEMGLDLLSEKNKYGRTVVQLGEILSFFQNKQISSLVRSAQKQKQIQLYRFNKQ